MLLSIKEMEVRRVRFANTWQAGEFDFPDTGVALAGPLVASGTAELLPDSGDQVRIQGNVSADLETDCDRCLRRAAFHIDAPFDLFYYPQTAAPDEDEVALDDGAVEIGFYELPGLELEDILREQVLLQLPMQRVCGDACKGICPVCGANRNETGCECAAVPGPPHAVDDDRWMALKDIHI